MNNATAAKALAEHRWKFYQSDDPGLLPDGNVLRRIDDIPHDDIDVLIQFLERYVSADNYNADDSARYAFVTGPQIDNHEREGRWRHVRCFVQRYDDQGRTGPTGSHWRIVQELAEGFLQSLSYPDARLVATRLTPGDAISEESTPEDAQGANSVFTLQWIGVDPDIGYLLASLLNRESVISDLAYRKVKHDGVTTTVPLIGDFHSLNVDVQQAPDGSFTVNWTVGEPTFTLDAFSNYNGAGQQSRLYWWDVPESFGDVVVSHFENTGSDVTASYNRQGTLDIIVDQLDFVKVDTGFHTYTSEDGTVGIRTVLNADTTSDLPGIISDLEALTAGNNTNLSITPAFGMPGKVNVVASYRPQNTDYRISSGNWNSLNTRTYNFPERTLPNGMLRPQTAVKVGFHSTETNAWTEYNTAIVATPAWATSVLIESFGKWAAGIQYMGQNKWRSIRIEEKLT